MKKITGLLALLTVLLVGCQSYSGPSGTAVVGIGDPSADMQGVTGIGFSIDQISLRQEQGNWIDIKTATPVETIDLLKLKQSNELSLLGVQSVPAGNYTELRLHIQQQPPMIVTDASSGAHFAIVPSNEIKVKTRFEVLEGRTSTAMFDFDAANSIVKTGEGKYIFKPVIRIETKKNVVLDQTQLSNGKVQINSGEKQDGFDYVPN